MVRIQSIYLLVLLTVGFIACDETESEPSIVTYRLVSATLDGEAVEPVPDYQLTLHFDSEEIPTIYEVDGTAVAAPTVGTEGAWDTSGGRVLFVTQDDRREVTADVDEITPVTERYELRWSLGKTDIDWEYAGDHVFVMEKVG